MTYLDFGSRVLKIGSSGTDVKILQYLLNKLPTPLSLPIIEEKGYFDKETEAAVKQFQCYFCLTADGVVANNTFLFLGEQTGPYLPKNATQFGSRVLIECTKGRDVWVLQNRLASSQKSYALALGKPADSSFASKTENAVRLFQSDQCLSDDGIVGPNTIMALYFNTYMGGRYLQYNRWERNQGYDVYFLQYVLNEMSYYKGPLDGKFGLATRAAVKALQKNAKIKVDGVVGPQTYFYLRKI